eukprot:6155255-Amphidinium_carterae.1
MIQKMIRPRLGKNPVLVSTGTGRGNHHNLQLLCAIRSEGCARRKHASCRNKLKVRLALHRHQQ